MAEKVRRLRVPDGVSVRTALVYAGTLSKGVRGSGYFDVLVPAETLLGLSGGEDGSSEG